MGRIKINWILAQQDYISCKETSLTDIARKYVISLSRVKQVAIMKKWKQTKDNIWERALVTSHKTVLDSCEQYVIRTSRIARYLQNTALRNLKKCFEALEEIKFTPKHAIHFLPGMVRIVAMGMKLERELYPKELIHKTTCELYEGRNDDQENPMSPQFKTIIYEVFKAELTGKKVELTIKDNNDNMVFENKYDFFVQPTGTYNNNTIPLSIV